MREEKTECQNELCIESARSQNLNVFSEGHRVVWESHRVVWGIHRVPGGPVGGIKGRFNLNYCNSK